MRSRAVRLSRLVVAAAALAASSGCGSAPPPSRPVPAPTVAVPEAVQLDESFDGAASMDRWVFTDPAAWRWRDGALELFAPSDYDPPVRSPRNIALLSDATVGDFTLEARLKQTGREYGHRDMCVFFGFQDASNFYYVHLASQADDHAHNVFVVRDAPRVKIATPATPGVRWGTDEWHHVRVERTLGDGRIAVFFDDELVIETSDRTFGWGHVGFGSFDDTGVVDDVVLRAPASRPGRAGF